MKSANLVKILSGLMRCPECIKGCFRKQAGGMFQLTNPKLEHRAECQSGQLSQS